MDFSLRRRDGRTDRLSFAIVLYGDGDLLQDVDAAYTGPRGAVWPHTPHSGNPLAEFEFTRTGQYPASCMATLEPNDVLPIGTWPFEIDFDDDRDDLPREPVLCGHVTVSDRLPDSEPVTDLYVEPGIGLLRSLCIFEDGEPRDTGQFASIEAIGHHGPHPQSASVAAGVLRALPYVGAAVPTIEDPPSADIGGIVFEVAEGHGLSRPEDVMHYEIVGWTGQADTRSGETLLAGRIRADCA